MKAYIMTIVGAALLAAFSDLLLPAAWRKYVRIITGLIIITTIIAPMAQCKQVDFFQDFELDDAVVEQGTQDLESRVAMELERRVAGDARERIAAEFGIDTEVRVEVQVNEQNQITEVRAIYVDGADIPLAVKDRLLEVYGAGEVVING